ncbi:MAG: hypothetical protein IJG94_07730 [Clostridia bacterium]|nr:hypothetical protein [Clostridia bacterium]
MAAQRVSRHNGRAGKSGAYSSKHNDRQFDAENAEHINKTRMLQNVYWDYLNGERTHAEQPAGEYPSFQTMEKQFYTERYSGYLSGQAERNRKSGHSNRNRTVDDLLHDKRICPEETILQIGKEGSETPPEVLLEVVHEYHDRFNQQFGEHVHIIDWALHLDETTPHVHERHVFDMQNGHGEIEPKQEKALELMGIPLPKPDQKPGKYNNRKMTFDAVCREMFIDVCKEHDISIEEEPIYGGQAYREKNDFIIESQRSEIAEQQETISQQQQTLAILQAQQAQNSQILLQQQATISNNASLLEDEQKLIDSIAAKVHDEAVNLTIENTVKTVQADNVTRLTAFKEKHTAPESKRSPEIRKLISDCLDAVIALIRNRTDKLIQRVKEKLLGPDIRTESIRKIGEEIKPSIHAMLREFREKQQNASSRSKMIHRESHESR